MHHITALVGKRLDIAAIASTLDAPVANLHQDFGLLALTEKLLAKLAAPIGFERGDPDEGFEYLGDGLTRGLLRASIDHEFGYVETEYFGGTGVQGAAVFSNGRITYGPSHDAIDAPGYPINEALKTLGVMVTKGQRDEFDSVGLGRFRSVDDWIEFGHEPRDFSPWGKPKQKGLLDWFKFK